MRSPYPFPRWYLVSGSAQLTSAGLVLNGTITQKLEHMPTGTVSAFVGMASGQANISCSSGTVTITSSDGVIAWAALYEGEYTDETKPDYHPRGYAAELAECQRYYIHFGVSYSPFAFGYTTDAANARAIIPLPTTMRLVPSIAGQTSFAMRGGAKSMTLNDPVVNSMLDNSVRIDFTGADLPTSECVVFYSTTIFGLSADL